MKVIDVSERDRPNNKSSLIYKSLKGVFMKSFTACLFLTVSISGFAQIIPTPFQASADTGKAIITYLEASMKNKFLSIQEISISGRFAKVELVDNEGNCSAIPFIVKYSDAGETTVHVNAAAFAVCD